MCLQRYGLDTKRNFWRRNDDVYPKRQIYFHFNSKSVIKNALELVLGPFTSNPQQVKKKIWGVLENSRTPPWKFPGPDQWFFAPWKIPGPPSLENSRTQPVTRSWIFLSTIHWHLSQSRFQLRWENLLRHNPLFTLIPWGAFHIKAQYEWSSSNVNFV